MERRSAEVRRRRLHGPRPRDRLLHAGNQVGEPVGSLPRHCLLQPGRHLGRALAFLQKADADSALAALAEGIRINPGNPALFAHRASVRAKRGDYDGAIADYTAALRLNPKDAYGYHNRGCVWGAKREFA